MSKCIFCGKSSLFLRVNSFGRCKTCEQRFQEKRDSLNRTILLNNNYYWQSGTFPYLPDSYVIVDTETSGLEYEHDFITEIAAIKIERGKVIDTYSSLIHNDKGVSSYITNLTGITSEMIKSCENTLEKVMFEFSTFIENKILIGHNILGFDIKFLNAAFKKVFNTNIKNKCIDTYLLAERCLVSESNSLLCLANTFNITANGNQHRALYDCKITLGVYSVISDQCFTNFYKWCKKGKAIQKTFKDYPKYITYEFKIDDPILFHNLLIEKGYLKEADLKTSLMTLTVQELKDIIKEHNMKFSGTKECLVNFIVANKIKPSIPTIYIPSEFGLSNYCDYAYKNEGDDTFARNH